MPLPTIKILIPYHKPDTLLKSDILVPIHVGRALGCKVSKDGQTTDEDLNWLIENMIGDDTGDNISYQNKELAELTAHYWAWKNYDALGAPDYIGFMQYRRHFIFNQDYQAETWQKRFGVTLFNTIDEEYLSATGLMDAQRIHDAIDRYDVIAWRAHSTKHTVYDQYQKEGCGDKWQLDAGAFDKAIKILKSQHPDYAAITDDYLKGNRHFWFNSYIMKRSPFFKYMKWLFSIISPLMKELEYSSYTIQGYRVAAHLAERLHGIFLSKLIADGKHTINYLPITLIKNTNITLPLKPAFSHNNIPVCTGCDDTYAQYASVLLTSIIENGAPGNNYDLVILADELNSKNIAKLKSLSRENVSVRVVNMKPWVARIGHLALYTRIHFTAATYHRLFVPLIFRQFQKVLYLDSDMLALDDVATVFNIDLNDNLAGAVLDIGAQYLYKINKLTREYIEIKLQTDIARYFNAGLMLFNIRQCEKENVSKVIFEKLAEIPQPRFVDQCILNAALSGRTQLLDPAWNLAWHIPILIPKFKSFLSARHCEMYLKAYMAPKIIHYTSPTKPWNAPDCELAVDWWRYARKSPFYEDLVAATYGANRQSVVSKQSETVAPTPPRVLLNQRMEICGRYYNPLLKTWWIKLFRFIAPKQTDALLLAFSGAFDTLYYFTTYPGLLKKKRNPIYGYVRKGASEGRNPNSWFDTSTYMTWHPELKKRNVNPLVHFLYSGEADTIPVSGSSTLKKSNGSR